MYYISNDLNNNNLTKGEIMTNSTQETFFRTPLELTNELTFLDFTKLEIELIEKEERKINNLICRYNNLSNALDSDIPASIKKHVNVELETTDIEIDFLINNYNIDLNYRII